MIRDVEHLAAELQAKPLLDLPSLAYGGVPVMKPGPRSMFRPMFPNV